MSNYRIERLIGIGGEAVVYEARPLLPDGDGPPVACKIMRQERQTKPRERALGRQEAALGLRITPGHCNLVRVLDCFEDAGARLCIVMELVAGVSLKALHGQGPRLPFPITRRIVTEVLEALVHLHGLDVLHRDLSPCNILISDSGIVKLTDLGIAKVMEQGQTHTASYRGKPVYASPEAIQTLTLDVRSDLYALGAVLYELLAGTPPCGEKESLPNIVMRALLEDFAPLPPDTPADLAELTMGLIRTDRDARWPQSASAALTLLRGHDRPMATTAELAAMVIARKAQRGAEPEGADRAVALMPGELLAPGDVLVARTALEPGEPMPDAVPAPPRAPLPPLVFPLPAEPPLPPLPQPRQRISAQLARPRPGRGRSHARGAVMRAVRTALLVFSVLMSGFLLHDRLGREHDAGTMQQRPEVPAPVAVPTPALTPSVQVTPERPKVAETEQTARPRHLRRKEHAAGSHPPRIGTQDRTRNARPDELRWELMPRRNEPSAWATP